MAIPVRSARHWDQVAMLRQAKTAAWQAWAGHCLDCGKCATNPRLYATGCGAGMQLVKDYGAALKAWRERDQITPAGSRQAGLW